MPLVLHGSSDVNLHQIVQAIVTVLAVINPVVCGSIFLTLTAKLTPPQRRWAAAKVTLSILVILVGSALIGLKVLSIFNISLDVFRIVGGMIIAYTCFAAATRSARRHLRTTMLPRRIRLLRSSCLLQD